MFVSFGFPCDLMDELLKRSSGDLESISLMTRNLCDVRIYKNYKSGEKVVNVETQHVNKSTVLAYDKMRKNPRKIPQDVFVTKVTSTSHPHTARHPP